MAAKNPTTDSLVGPLGSTLSQGSGFTRTRRPAPGVCSIGSAPTGRTATQAAGSGPARA